MHRKRFPIGLCGGGEGGESNMFDVLDSGLNDYGKIITQHFASSENYRQLEVVIRILKICGLSPSFAFSDVLDKDHHLLK